MKARMTSLLAADMVVPFVRFALLSEESTRFPTLTTNNVVRMGHQRLVPDRRFSAFVRFAQLGDHGEVFERSGVALDFAVCG